MRTPLESKESSNQTIKQSYIHIIIEAASPAVLSHDLPSEKPSRITGVGGLEHLQGQWPDVKNARQVWALDLKNDDGEMKTALSKLLDDNQADVMKAANKGEIALDETKDNKGRRSHACNTVPLKFSWKWPEDWKAVSDVLKCWMRLQQVGTQHIKIKP